MVSRRVRGRFAACRALSRRVETARTPSFSRSSFPSFSFIFLIFQYSPDIDCDVKCYQMDNHSLAQVSKPGCLENVVDIPIEVRLLLLTDYLRSFKLDQNYPEIVLRCTCAHIRNKFLPFTTSLFNVGVRIRFTRQMSVDSFH